jgi:hypothetical protein
MENKEMENSNSCLDSSQDPIFEPCQHHKGACTEKVFEQATEAVNYKHFRISFNEYLLSTLEDLVQIVHYREKLLTSLQVATSFVAPLEDKQDVTWCALSRLSQRYCQRKADMFNWSDDVRQEQEHRLIRILTPCWLMERRNEKLAIEVLKAWRVVWLMHNPNPTMEKARAKTNKTWSAGTAAKMKIWSTKTM